MREREQSQVPGRVPSHTLRVLPVPKPPRVGILKTSELDATPCADNDSSPSFTSRFGNGGTFCFPAPQT